MSAVVTHIPGASNILGTTLHHLDVEKKKYVALPVPGKIADLQTYLESLLAEVDAKTQSRAYLLNSATTEFAVSLASFHHGRALVPAAAEALVARLLRMEVATDQRYGHLSVGVGPHVKRGSFLQVLYEKSGVLSYLAVKVEHQAFLDESDFKRRIGLGETQKIYKACRLEFDATGKPLQALVYDTNSKPSVYWWDDVWELHPVRSNEVNTKDAIEHVIHRLNKIKKISPVDYNLLRNASVTAFKQAGAMDFDHFVTSTFAGYTPVEPSLVNQLPKLVNDLKLLPANKGFDGHFTLAPAAVPYKARKIELTDGIMLSYSEELPHLADKIWSTKTKDGKSVVVVEAPEAAKMFTFKAWK